MRTLRTTKTRVLRFTAWLEPLSMCSPGLHAKRCMDALKQIACLIRAARARQEEAYLLVSAVEVGRHSLPAHHSGSYGTEEYAAICANEQDSSERHSTEEKYSRLVARHTENPELRFCMEADHETPDLHRSCRIMSAQRSATSSRSRSLRRHCRRRRYADVNPTRSR